MTKVIEISNYRDILYKENLSNGDNIIFIVDNNRYDYQVCGSFLLNIGDDTKFRNYEIFKALNLDGVDFCSKAYGYEAGGGSFPSCKNNDYTALTSVVIALFKEIEKRIITNSFGITNIPGKRAPIDTQISIDIKTVVIKINL